LITLPNSIQDALTEIEKQLMKANAMDDTVGQKKLELHQSIPAVDSNLGGCWIL